MLLDNNDHDNPRQGTTVRILSVVLFAAVCWYFWDGQLIWTAVDDYSQELSNAFGWGPPEGSGGDSGQVLSQQDDEQAPLPPPPPLPAIAPVLVPPAAPAAPNNPNCKFNGKILLLGKGVDDEGGLVPIMNVDAAPVVMHGVYSRLKQACPGQVFAFDVWHLKDIPRYLTYNVRTVLYMSYVSNWVDHHRQYMQQWWWMIKNRICWFDDYNGYRSDLVTAARGDFTVLAHPLKKVAETLPGGPGTYMPWGADESLLITTAKSEKPSLIIDYHPGCCSLSTTEVVQAAKILQEKFPGFTAYSSGFCDEASGITCLPSLPLLEYYTYLNKVWVYVTVIKGTFERAVLESQMAGCYVISIDDVTNRELYEPTVTGFVTPNRAKDIALVIGKIFEKYDSAVPRKYAMERYSMGVVTDKLQSFLKFLPE